MASLRRDGKFGMAIYNTSFLSLGFFVVRHLDHLTHD